MSAKQVSGSKKGLSIVIVYRNRAQHLQVCLDLLMQQERFPLDAMDVIVSDYGSDDPKELTVLLERYPKLNVQSVYTDEKGEWCNAKAKNIGVKLAQRERLLLLNPDAWLAPLSLHVAYTVFELAQSFWCIVQGQRWDISKPATDELYHGDLCDLHSLLCDVPGPGLSLHSREAFGDFQMMNTADYWKIGGYCERFHGWGADDTDFVESAKYHGFMTVWIGDDSDGDIRIIHPWHDRDQSAQWRNRELLQERRNERKHTGSKSRVARSA